MSFLRHKEIYPFDGGASGKAGAPAHRLDEFPAGYSLAGWSPPVRYQTLRLDKEARNWLVNQIA